VLLKGKTAKISTWPAGPALYLFHQPSAYFAWIFVLAHREEMPLISREGWVNNQGNVHEHLRQ
jgi:hypothetical protein